MEIRESYPHAIELISHCEIPLSDGTKLAARIWLPKSAKSRPVPAILEYIPYRLSDFTANRDAHNHAYFAGFGYASIRVDIRGSGNSEGIITDEYSPQELQDGLEILNWISNQSWCDGNIGMIGISWGGFNGLQLAALKPESLKAIISVCSTDDRYADDIHSMGGCLLGDNLSWASTMYAYNSCPPDPAVVGDKWKQMWLERLSENQFWLEEWLKHLDRDDYWKHGSICEDYSQMQCPVYLVSGWADGYSNAVFRMLQNLSGPRKGLVGAWGHKYPHMGLPGPTMGFLQEAVRWWDHWLKGNENGIMDEPMLQVWMQDSVPPSVYYSERPGRWVAEESWPSDNIDNKRLKLGSVGLVEEASELNGETRDIESPLSVGLFAGKWCSFSATPDLPHDQREEDGGALVFESEVLESDLDLLGAPCVDLVLESNQAHAMLAARLSDVGEDQKATRVTFGLLNLNHFKGHDQPQKLVPGEPYRVRLSMNEIAHSFKKGNRLRLSLSTSYWPIAWPAPKPARLRLHLKDCFLDLPFRKTEGPDIRSFAAAEAAPTCPTEQIKPREYEWLVKRDLARDKSTLEVIKDEGESYLKDMDLAIRRRVVERYSYEKDDYNTLRGVSEYNLRFARGVWRPRIHTKAVLESTPSHFVIYSELDAYLGKERVHSASNKCEIPRN